MTALQHHPLLPFSNLPPAPCPSRQGGNCTKRRGRQALDQPKLRLLSLVMECGDLESSIGVVVRHSDRHLKRTVVNFWAVTKEKKEPVLLDRVFVVDQIVHLSNFVPKRKYAYLTKHYESWILRVSELHDVAAELADLGFVFLGDIIQLQPEDISRMTSASPETITILEQDLATVGLKLGMQLPPSCSFLRAQLGRQ